MSIAAASNPAPRCQGVGNLAHVAATSRDLAGRISLALKTRPETLDVSRAFAHRFRQM